MTTPINPAGGAPIQRPNADKPKAANTSPAKFTVPGEPAGDTVATRGLALGSLGPLVKTDLNKETAPKTAKQIEQHLSKEPHAIANARPQTIQSLFQNDNKKPE